jgi:hypothetical protein
MTVMHVDGRKIPVPSGLSRSVKAGEKPIPIPTRYKGILFRSRLEARWAVFFDAIGCPWEYEPEWFLMPSGVPYLPDFRLNGQVWAEVKPPGDNGDKARAFGERVILLNGPPGTNSNVFQIFGARDYCSGKCEAGQNGGCYDDECVASEGESVFVGQGHSDRFFFWSWGYSFAEMVQDSTRTIEYSREIQSAIAQALSERFGS